jgi:hypothetical protein
MGGLQAHAGLLTADRLESFGGTGFQPVQHRLKTCATNIFS